MTTTTPTRSPMAVHSLGLRTALVVAPLGPLAIGVVRAVLPTYTDDDPATIAAQAAAHPGAQSAVLWLTYLGLLTLPLGLLIVARLAIRTRPVLGTIGAVVSWIGFTSLFLIVANDQIALAGPAVGAPPSTVAALIGGVQSLPAVSMATEVFVAGHILGTVLLGIAVWPAVPRWAAAALIVSQPLHLVFAVVVPNHLLDGLAWGLTALGFAAVAATPMKSSSSLR
jgi:hypothetical protein